ncbi:MAG: Integration host factor subunit alpha [Legionellaceae bacterium]
MTLTKAEIEEQLSLDVFSNDKKLAKKFVDIFFEEIRFSLEKGEEIKLSGFGNFTLKDKKTRPGRNPKTGESKEITSRRVVTFQTGQKLRKQLEQLK